MKIIETKSAPNPRRVRMFLAEKGITVPFEEIDINDVSLRVPMLSAACFDNCVSHTKS